MQYFFELQNRIRYLLKYYRIKDGGFGFLPRFISRIWKYLSIDSTRCWFAPSLPASLITGTHYSMISNRILLKGFKCYKSRLQDWYLNEGKFKHVALLLIDLHWLPIKQSIMFKSLVTTYKALNGLAPGYSFFTIF